MDDMSTEKQVGSMRTNMVETGFSPLFKILNEETEKKDERGGDEGTSQKTWTWDESLGL